MTTHDDTIADLESKLATVRADLAADQAALAVTPKYSEERRRLISAINFQDSLVLRLERRIASLKGNQ